jgi:hypothetical protein
MKKSDLLKLAKSISADIRAHFECLGVGMGQTEYLNLRNRSDLAVKLAEYLAIEKNDKIYFLNACGLRAAALEEYSK